ncbi:MAG: CBS domain-containing protein [Armatimonadetes bacterium]|nr:CBS domain-containing protein [Armatimonadota bacterium]
MATAKDIMTQDVVTVSPDTLVRDVAKILSEKRISGVPVVEGGKVVGICSEADVLRAGSMDKTAGDIMVTDVVSVTPDTDVQEIAQVLTEHGIKRVPVLDAEGTLVGIVSRADIVRSIAG